MSAYVTDFISLPAEVWFNILEELIVLIGPNEAVRLRLISKFFDREIPHALVSTRAFQFDRPRSLRRLRPFLVPQRLPQLTTYITECVLSGGRRETKLSEWIHLSLDGGLLGHSYSKAEYRAATISLLDTIIQTRGYDVTLRLLSRNRPRGDYYVYNYPDTEKLSHIELILAQSIKAAALLGNFASSTTPVAPYWFRETIFHDTPPQHSMAHGQLEMVQIMLIKFYNFSNLQTWRSPRNPRPLLANNKAREETAKLLLQPDFYPSYLNRLLVMATERLNRVSMTQSICGRLGENLQLSDMFEHALLNGHNDMVNLCLDSGVSINKKVQCIALKQTPLALAARGGHLDTVALLLSRGANVKATTGVGSPLYEASRLGFTRIVELLLNSGAELSSCPLASPFAKAAACGQAHIVSLLLSRGLDTHKPKNVADYALNRAVTGGYSSIVRLLLQAGVNKDGPQGLNTPERQVPMLLALIYGHTHVVDTLLQLGARAIDPSKTTLAENFRHGELPCQAAIGLKPILSTVEQNLARIRHTRKFEEHRKKAMAYAKNMNVYRDLAEVIVSENEGQVPSSVGAGLLDKLVLSDRSTL